MSNIAKEIYENQLRIEEEQRGPFLKSPIREPQLSKRAQRQMRGNNPFYKLPPNYDMLSSLQLTKLLSQLGITMPVGVNPYSSEGRAHITNQLRVMSNTSGEKLDSVTDLIRLAEDPSMKFQKTLDEIKTYQKQIRDSSIMNLDSILANNSKGAKQGAKQGTGAGVEETKEEIPVAGEIAYLSDDQMLSLKRPELIKYANNTLKLSLPKNTRLDDARKAVIDFMNK